MIMLFESGGGGMTTKSLKEETIREVDEDKTFGRYYTTKDTFDLKKFIEIAEPGDYMHYSKGVMVKVEDQLTITNKTAIPIT